MTNKFKQLRTETMMKIPKIPEYSMPKLKTSLPPLKKREIIKKQIDKRTKFV